MALLGRPANVSVVAAIVNGWDPLELTPEFHMDEVTPVIIYPLLVTLCMYGVLFRLRTSECSKCHSLASVLRTSDRGDGGLLIATTGWIGVERDGLACMMVQVRSLRVGAVLFVGGLKDMHAA